MAIAYIGLGSNLADPRCQVEAALAALVDLPQTHLLGASRLYGSTPLGPQDQPDFVNAVAAVDTALAPLALLRALQGLEQQQGRQRQGERWGPRTLDLDLLLYGQRTLETPELRLPHPGLCERNFVLYPLYELAPDVVVPGRGAVRQLLETCDRAGLWVLDA